MRNNKGFTLIELLAVIIILAIIAVITTPIILNVVNDARKDAASDKAWGTIDAVRITYAQYQAKDTAYTGDAITVDFEGGQPTIGEMAVKMSGQKPQSGTVTINTDGTITCDNLKFDSYYCTTNDGTTMTCEAKKNVK